VLVGRWLDLYLQILPALSRSAPGFSLWDVALVPGTLGLVAWILARPRAGWATC